jgi:ribosome-associated toxin RatA of RatAB toxin-antitoxin module
MSTDRTSASAIVGAPPAAVMAVIADFPAYPEWATAVRSAEVTEPSGSGADTADGRASRVRFALDAGVIKDRYVLAYEWDDDTYVRWRMAEAGSVISEMDGSYRLTGTGDGTEVTYELAVNVKIPMIGMLKRKAEKMIIDTALKELKKRAESLESSQ